MNINTYISPNVLISDIVLLVGDDSFTFKSKGFYIGQIQACLNELAFDTFFQEGYIDVDVPTETLCLPMPENIFNIKQMFLFNGDDCNLTSATTVYHKRNYVAKKSGYTARVTSVSNGDPFQMMGHGHDSNYFYEVQNGLIMLSAYCQTFDKLRIYYNGVGGKIEDAPVIPLFFRQVIIDWVSLRALDMKIMSNPAGNTFLYAIRDRIDKRLNDPYEGSYIKAQRRVSNIDRKEKDDLITYYGRLNY